MTVPSNNYHGALYEWSMVPSKIPLYDHWPAYGFYTVLWSYNHFPLQLLMLKPYKRVWGYDICLHCKMVTRSR